jgi:hypothetical protein
MTDPQDTIGKDIWAAFLAFLSLGVIGACTFTLFRLLVPAILSAHFYGSVFLAAVVGFFGTVGIGLLALFLFSRVVRLFSK